MSPKEFGIHAGFDQSHVRRILNNPEKYQWAKYGIAEAERMGRRWRIWALPGQGSRNPLVPNPDQPKQPVGPDSEALQEHHRNLRRVAGEWFSQLVSETGTPYTPRNLAFPTSFRPEDLDRGWREKGSLAWEVGDDGSIETWIIIERSEPLLVNCLQEHFESVRKGYRDLKEALMENLRQAKGEPIFGKGPNPGWALSEVLERIGSSVYISGSCGLCTPTVESS